MKKNLIITFVLLFSFLVIHAFEQADQYSRNRKDMIEYQIKRRGIKDEKILEIMQKIPRHLFIPSIHWNQAYEDRPLPIGEHQTISQPYIVAFMTEVLRLKPDDKVLEIGTGSGYQAAILAELAREVYTIEIIEILGKTAERVFKDLGYNNIKVKIGDGYKGWKEYAPYDAIIVTCAPDHIPTPLIEQLKEGGRMVIPVGDYYNQELILVEKKEGKIVKKEVMPVIFVPMTGEGINGKK